MKSTLFATAIFLSALSPLAAHADLPGNHPAYLHAISDLRAARWNLEHRPGDPAVSGQEDVAIDEIDRAIGEIKNAAMDDGKNMYDQPHEDANLDRPGRLHHAVELLRRAHADMDQEEDNPESRQLKHRALKHVDIAIGATERAVREIRAGF